MKPKHWLLFFLLGAIWSSSFMWIKIAVNEIDPDTLVAFRVLFGFLFCTAVIFIQKIKLPSGRKTWMPLLILGITNLIIPFFLIAWGEKSIDSSVASVLDSTVPLFTILIAHFLLNDDKMTLSKITGLLIGFIGVIVLLSKDIDSSSGSVAGQAAVIIASLFYAVSGVYARRTTQNIPGILRSGGPLFFASVIMWIFTFASGKPVQIPSAGLTWLSLLFLGVIGSGVAFFLVYYLIHEIGPTLTSMVTYLFPLGGVIFGVTVLNEEITWQLLAGGILIIVSLIVSNLQSRSKAILAKAK